MLIMQYNKTGFVPEEFKGVGETDDCDVCATGAWQFLQVPLLMTLVSDQDMAPSTGIRHRNIIFAQ